LLMGGQGEGGKEEITGGFGRMHSRGLSELQKARGTPPTVTLERQGGAGKKTDRKVGSAGPRKLSTGEGRGLEKPGGWLGCAEG